MSYPPDSHYGQGSGVAGGQYGSAPQGQPDQFGGYGQTQPIQSGYQQPGYHQSGYGQPAPNPQPGAGGGYSSPPPAQRSRGWLAPVIAIATLAAGLGIGVLARGEDPPITPAALPAVTVTATRKVPPATETVTVTRKAPPTTAKGTSSTTPIVFDGLWKVGTDIMPGIYLAIPAEDSPGCYVAWLGSKDKNDILNYYQGKPGKPVKAEVPSPRLAPYFYSKNCGFWLLTDE